jgi:putative transposase
MAHSTTILAQVLKLVSRSQIEALDKVYGTGRPSRGLSRWSQFGALVFAQLAGRHSLRDVACALASQAYALAPLGLRPPKRSTLAEANARRPVALYQALFETLYARCRGVAPKHRFRFKNPLLSLDSTTISLCLSVFPWACFRTTKGAIKVHTLLDHAGHIPAVMVLTEGKRSDLAVARGFHLPVDSIVTMDRGYIDYQFLFRLHQDGVYFVTRQKVNAQVEVTTRFAIDRSTGVTADHDVVLTGPKGRAYPARLRQVQYRDAATGKRDVFWTNAFHLAAPTIAAIYKQRWQIELFFKAIKQNLRIKTFLGTSENAVMTQVWVALIAYLLLAFLRFQAGLALSFQQMLRLLQINLFERRNLIDLCRLQPPDAAGSQLLRAV